MFDLVQDLKLFCRLLIVSEEIFIVSYFRRIASPFEDEPCDKVEDVNESSPMYYCFVFQHQRHLLSVSTGAQTLLGKEVPNLLSGPGIELVNSCTEV